MTGVNVFISYSGEHAPYAHGLMRALGETGISVFSFLHTPLIPGSNFPLEVANHIYHAHFVALLWGSDSVTSSWLQQEIAFAQEHNKLIIPILLDASVNLPSNLASTQAVLAYADPAGWILQVRDSIHSIIQQLQEQQRAQLQQQQKKTSWLKNLAGGVITVGILGALFSAMDDEDDNA